MLCLQGDSARQIRGRVAQSTHCKITTETLQANEKSCGIKYTAIIKRNANYIAYQYAMLPL